MVINNILKNYKNKSFSLDLLDFESQIFLQGLMYLEPL